MATAAITGTTGDGATETEVKAGGGTIIITLSGDTWIAGGTPQVMGYDTIGGNSGITYQSAEVLAVFTAPVSGTLQTAYAYHALTNSETCKVGVYLDAGTANDVDASDTKVAISGVISSSTDGEWASAAFSGGAITQGNKYWIVLAGGSATNGWQTRWDSDGGGYGHDGGNNVYTNEPAALDGTYSPLARHYSAYVTIQP